MLHHKLPGLLRTASMGKGKEEPIASPLNQHRLTEGPPAQPASTFLTSITL